MTAPTTTSLDYRRLVRQSRKLVPNGAKQTVRMAVLSDAASQQFVPLLRTLFHENGVHAELYEGPFDALELEALNPASGLYAFQPDVIVLATCTQALRTRYYQHGGDFLDVASDQILRVWDALQSRSSARLIQFNFALPYEREFGNYDLLVARSLYSTVVALNSRIALHASRRSNVLVCDVDAVAAHRGRACWFDERLWVLSKTFCELDCLPYVAQSVVDIVLACLGRVVKCIVLDLDNTLWGGVVGDDGHLGIAVGPHGDGEAFYHFQQFLLSLKKRGILLTVCSKNDRENAIRPFRENPGMVLKYEDITVFVANWDNKADNIRAIRDSLQIGFDSMVFLDDNPFERNLVREFLPEVRVPELPEDPADYVRALCGLNLFETSSFSAEDVRRSELYSQDASRRELQTRCSNLDEYLQSLEMKIQVARFEPAVIPRIAQLIQRSNQFNLTTHRYNEAECEAMMRDEAGCVPLYARLRDRFGDHGLISVVVLEFTPTVLVIRDWLMSCRVLGRGVEQYLMTRVVGIAAQKRLCKIVGRYIPTAKNAMVKEFYAQFGFEKTVDSEDGSEWHLDTGNYHSATVYIAEDA